MLLKDQDRSQWDKAEQIEESQRAWLRARSKRACWGTGGVGLQAAIAVEHANASSAAATRWDHIAALYSHLAALSPAIRSSNSTAPSRSR